MKIIKNILGYVGHHGEGILIGCAIGNFMWAIQPKYSQGLVLVQSGMKAPFILIGLLFVLAFFMIMGYYRIKDKLGKKE